jgi:hypothetical protein
LHLRPQGRTSIKKVYTSTIKDRLDALELVEDIDYSEMQDGLASQTSR